MRRKVVIAGGGTGGHVFMGIALAKELQYQDPQCEVIFVGTRRGLEVELVPRAGFQLELIDVAALKGLPLKQLLANLLLLPKGLAQSRAALKRLGPSLVIGVGGYASGPMVLVAALMRIPTLIIEPNVVPGFTNRVLSSFASEAAIAFEETRRYLRGKGVVTGVPVRSEFYRVPRKGRDGKINVLICGGSQGSHAINLAVCAALPELKNFSDKIWIVHQTGKADFKLVAEAYRNAEIKADVRTFIDDMPSEYARADLIISRAGAATVAELTASGRAAILIPFQHATDQHQRRNAEALAIHGAAIMLEEKELNGRRLAQTIVGLIENPQRIDEMERSILRLRRPNATERIANLAMRLMRT